MSGSIPFLPAVTILFLNIWGFMSDFLRKFSEAGALLISMAFFINQAFAEGNPASSPPLKLEYKKFFKDAGKDPIVSSSFKTGAIKYVEWKGVNSPDALLLSSKDLKDKYLGFNLKVPGANLKDFKGKALVLSFYIKYLQGSGNIAVTIRNFQNLQTTWKLISSSSKEDSCELKGANWERVEFKCRIPDMPEVDLVDFQIGTYPSGLVEFLIDEPVLQAVETKDVKYESGLMYYSNQNGNTPLELVKDGKALAVIVTDAKATECVKYAVKELNDHIELCTGAKLPVVTDDKKIEGSAIYVGKTILSERLGVSPDMLSPDSWIVRRVDNAIIISGGDNKYNLNPKSKLLVPFGTLYAAYEFLERQLKVRWYWPGKLGTVAPENKNIIIGNINWTGNPSYNTRFAFYSVPDDKDISTDETTVWWRRMRWGSVGGSPIGMHSFNQWPGRFAKDHPEYFAIQPDGKPLLNASNGGGHVCFSNPDVLKQTIQDKRNEFDQTNWKMFSNVMPGDSDNLYYCRCDKCKSQVKPGGNFGLRSNAVWSFVNKVAAEVRKTNPKQFITCCAYMDYQDVPDFSVESNIAVTLCIFFPEMYWTENSKEKYVRVLDAWEKTGASMYMWDYLNNPRYYKGTRGAPAIYPHAIKEFYMLDNGRAQGHVLELSDINSRGERDAGSKWADWIYDSPNVYVAMRLLWNMDQDVDVILDEFYEGFYGPDAAPYMKKFYEEMELAYENPNTKGGPDFKWDWENCWLKTYPPAFIERVMGYLRKADEVSKGHEPYNARARKTLDAYLPFEANGKIFGKAVRKNDRVLKIPLALTSPEMNGDIDSPCWKNAVSTGNFVDSFNASNLLGKTEMFLMRDNQNLYIGVRATFTPESKLKLDLPQNSIDRYVWDDESCEFFFSQGDKIYQFMLGPGNVFADLYQADIKQTFDLAQKIKWNCKGIKYITKIKTNEWTAELVIPLSSLELTSPTEANPWKVNFCRNYYYAKEGGKRFQHELSTWSPTYGSFDNVKNFGRLVF